MGIVHKH